MKQKGLLYEYAAFFSFIARGIDALCSLLAGWLSFLIFAPANINKSLFPISVVFSILLLFALFPRFKLYLTWRGMSVLQELKALLAAWSLVFIGLCVIAFVTKTTDLIDLFGVKILISWFLFGFIFLSSYRIVLRLFLRWLRSSGRNKRRIVIVGGGDLAEFVIKRISSAPWVGLDIVGIFEDNEKANESLASRCSGALDEMADFVKANVVDQVWFCLPLRAEKKMKKALEELEHETVDVKYIPDIFGFSLLNHSVSEIAGVPAVNLRSTPMIGFNRVVKSIEDKILALLILIIISPVMVIIAIGVKLTSPGPVIFKQRRHGWDGKYINVYKFRSMKVHDESDGKVTQATKSDPRITKLGAFLRKTSLDELPQFINVLQGKMSIVGPRPHAIEHNYHYKNLVDKYMLRHKVKPGITGWAQVNGFRGETDTLDKMEDRVKYDLYYIENWSVWFDLKIVVMTILGGFLGKNAY